jgi:acyl-CoA thioesterase FadM
VTFSYRIVRASDRHLLAEGATEMACVRSVGTERRPSLLPEELRGRLESALAEGPSPSLPR